MHNTGSGIDDVIRSLPFPLIGSEDEPSGQLYLGAVARGFRGHQDSVVQLDLDEECFGSHRQLVECARPGKVIWSCAPGGATDRTHLAVVFALLNFFAGELQSG